MHGVTIHWVTPHSIRIRCKHSLVVRTEEMRERERAGHRVSATRKRCSTNSVLFFHIYTDHRICMHISLCRNVQYMWSASASECVEPDVNGWHRRCNAKRACIYGKLCALLSACDQTEWLHFPRHSILQQQRARKREMCGNGRTSNELNGMETTHSLATKQHPDNSLNTNVERVTVCVWSPTNTEFIETNREKEVAAIHTINILTENQLRNSLTVPATKFSQILDYNIVFSTPCIPCASFWIVWPQCANIRIT